MKNYKVLIYTTILLFALLVSCEKYDPQLGDPPTAGDATFSYSVSDTSDNILILTADRSDVYATWDFGNGIKSTGTTVSAIYPFAGSYTITLTVFNKGGSSSSTQDIVIDQTDFGLVNNPLWNSLTGGVNGPGYKIWYIDSTVTGHMGVGPNPSESPIWWQAGPLEKSCAGMYDDRYVFYLNNFQFDMLANGEIFANDAHAAAFPNGYSSCGDWISPYADQLGQTWTITEDDGVQLNLTGNSFLGFYAGSTTFNILELTDSTMSIQFEDTEEPTLMWYHKLRAEQ